MSESTSSIRQATRDRWAHAEAVRNHWVYTAAVGTQIEDLSVPTYWAYLGANVLAQVRSWDWLEVREENGAWHLLAIVRHVHLGEGGLEIAGIKGTILEGVGPSGAAKPMQPDLAVRHMGAHHKWCAMRGEVVLKSGFETQAQASLWITEYAKTTAEGKP